MKGTEKMSNKHLLMIIISLKQIILSSNEKEAVKKLLEVFDEMIESLK